MGRYRSRSRSYSSRRSRSYSSRRSRSPLRSKRYDDPRDRYRGSGMSYRDRRFSGPSGLLVRNISLDARPEDLRKPFERFGPVKDVYLPKNYYTGEPRGFGFVKFHNPEDAAEAKEHMNHQVIGGREIRIAFAEENRKTPQEMRKSVRISDRSDRYRRRSSPRSPRHRYRSYSRSPTPVRRSSRSGGHSSRYDDYYSPRRSISRSPSPKRGRSISRSPSRSLSPRGRKSISRSPSRSLSPRGRKSISRSPSPRISRSVSPRGRKSISRSVTPPGKRSISRSLSPRRSISRSPALRRSFSRSPAPRRSISRPPSPRRSISRPPSHDNGYRSSRRLPSPRDNGRSPSRSRSYSPRR